MHPVARSELALLRRWCIAPSKSSSSTSPIAQKLSGCGTTLVITLPESNSAIAWPSAVASRPWPVTRWMTPSA